MCAARIVASTDNVLCADVNSTGQVCPSHKRYDMQTIGCIVLVVHRPRDCYMHSPLIDLSVLIVLSPEITVLIRNRRCSSRRRLARLERSLQSPHCHRHHAGFNYSAAASATSAVAATETLLPASALQTNFLDTLLLLDR